MDLSATIKRFAMPHTVRRATGARTVGADGFATAPGTQNLTLQLVITPATGRDMQQLPEGQRTEATIAVLSASELKTADVATGCPADQILRGGDYWLVVSVEHWEQGNYYRALAQRMGR